MQSVDWQRIAPEVAKQLLGEPSSISSKELRWGTHGSFSLNLESATWYDHENAVGGGITDLIKYHNQDVATILKSFGYDQALLSDSLLSVSGLPQNNTNKGNARSFDREQLEGLSKQAVVHLQYNDSFMVMRFPEGHHIKQKYAPFSKNSDDTWSMVRPEGDMPIYYTDEAIKKPIIINEGEKALLACKKLYDGDSCTWHGGVNSWKKANWTPVLKRDIWIWPDNDKAGKKCANEMAEYLRAKGCKSVKIINPPKDFKDKDDLHDALDSGYFTTSRELESFVNNQKEKLPKGALRFEKADKVLSQVVNHDWLITDVFERERLITVFGAPKSGKSFIAIAMACSVAIGEEFYGHGTKKAPVLYLCGEGVSGVRRRLASYEQYEFTGSLKGAPLFLSNRGSRINEPDEFEKLENEINLIKEEVGDIGLIIFDTFQRNFSGDENSAQEVNKFVKAADQLIHDFGCSVLLVHHTGRGNKGRARGSSVLDASIDGEFLVERKGTKPDNANLMLVKMSQTKNKDGMEIPPKNFEFHEEHLTGEGLDVTSGLLVLTDEKLEDKFDKDAVHNAEDIKIANLMYAMGKDKEDGDKWFTAADFKHHAVYNTSGKDITRHAINNSFKRLEENGIVIHAKRDKKTDKSLGYRLVEDRYYADDEIINP
jgi:KaiC/GvpD/RAD55 family RecA-like ATPase/5S rRNA maturation endonuclease (ribonuclease M5)